MKVRFWGVRGSIPSPGPATVRYGGNTTCIEVRTDDDTLIILDAGTGIYPLAMSLLKSLPVEAFVFITHTHWDHIQGLPFFVPLFIPGNRIVIHGSWDIVSGQGIEQAMNVQMQYSFFPVREAELKARINYRIIAVGESMPVNDATVTSFLMNHPVVNLGYRIDCNGRSVFFTGDHEAWDNIYAPGEEGWEDYERMLNERRQQFEESIRGVDLLICDSSYTESEYPVKRGWGHGTFDHNIALARRVGARRLACTHHEPTRSDDELERVFGEALARADLGAGDPEVMLAREGLVVEL